MKLDEVHQGIKKHKRRRRIGRGPGSGHGKTAGRGHKGAGSRAGYSRKATFQGGAMSLVRRIPKRGFNNKWAKQVAVVNVGELGNHFAAGEEVTPALLTEKHLAKGRFDLLKILGEGELSVKLKVAAHRFSKTATEKIVKAGGEVVIIPGPTPVAVKQRAAREKARAKG